MKLQVLKIVLLLLTVKYVTAQTSAVLIADTPLYEKAENNSAVLSNLKIGQEFKVIEIKNGWYKIETGKQSGWAPAKSAVTDNDGLHITMSVFFTSGVKK